jgi:hypothetical protein
MKKIDERQVLKRRGSDIFSGLGDGSAFAFFRELKFAPTSIQPSSSHSCRSIGAHAELDGSGHGQARRIEIDMEGAQDYNN